MEEGDEVEDVVFAQRVDEAFRHRGERGEGFFGDIGFLHRDACGLQRVGLQDEFGGGLVEEAAGDVIAVLQHDGGVLELFGDDLGGFDDALQQIAGVEAGGDGGEVRSHAAAFVTEAVAEDALGIDEGLLAFGEAAVGLGLVEFVEEVGHLPFLHKGVLLRGGEGGLRGFAAFERGFHAGEQGLQFLLLAGGEVHQGFGIKVLQEVREAGAVTVSATGFFKPFFQERIVVLAHGHGARFGARIIRLVELDVLRSGHLLAHEGEVLFALIEGPALRGAEVEEVVDLFFLRGGIRHELEGLGDGVRRVEVDEDLREFAVQELGLGGILCVEFRDDGVCRRFGRAALARATHGDDAEFIELL